LACSSSAARAPNLTVTSETTTRPLVRARPAAPIAVSPRGKRPTVRHDGQRHVAPILAESHLVAGQAVRVTQSGLPTQGEPRPRPIRGSTDANPPTARVPCGCRAETQGVEHGRALLRWRRLPFESTVADRPARRCRARRSARAWAFGPTRSPGARCGGQPPAPCAGSRRRPVSDQGPTRPDATARYSTDRGSSCRPRSAGP